MELLDALRSQMLGLSALAKFAIAITVIVGVPPLARRVGLPEAVGLLLFGVVLGPHVLGFFGEDRPVANFFAELGKLLLMFSAGLEIDVALFRKAQKRSITFGLVTTAVPLLLCTLFGLAFGYAIIPAIVIGSLLASHTLLGPFTTGFSVPALAVQLLEIGKVRNNEDAEFVLMLGIMALAGMLADYINLPGIVGAFLAGLAVNAAVRERAAKEKLDFFGKALFIPCFFVATGFLIDPIVFAQSVLGSLPLVAGLIGTLVLGKWIAATVVGRAFGYTAAARSTIWALTLPQVAATLATALVAHHTFNAAGQRMRDETMLNAVLVLMLATSILGPLLTERFAPRMLDAKARAAPITRVIVRFQEQGSLREQMLAIRGISF